jgi:hypothetical protein
MRQPVPVPSPRRRLRADDNPGAPARPSLPYGAVMATGAASSLAGPAGAGFASRPLLWLTVAVAAAVPARYLLTSVTAGRHGGRRQAAPGGRFGEFTVPIGLAVIGKGLAGIPGTAALAAAACAVALAWLATLAVAAGVLAPVLSTWPGVTAADGTWFLAPAALLASAIGLAGLITRSPALAAPWLSWLALAAAGLGALGYAAVVAVAAWRVAAAGLAGAPLVPWWISAGCGGLAAAALGQAAALGPLAAGPLAAGTAGFRALGFAAMGCWAAGSALLIPVASRSAWFLLRHPAGRMPWPPVFSAGVYALGAAQAGKLLALPPVTGIATVAAVSAVALWAAAVLGRVTAIPDAAAVLRRALRERGGQRPPRARERRPPG